MCSHGRTIASDLALIIVGFPITTAEFTGWKPLQRQCPKVEGDLERFSGKEGRRKQAKAERENMLNCAVIHSGAADAVEAVLKCCFNMI